MILYTSVAMMAISFTTLSHMASCLVVADDIATICFNHMMEFHKASSIMTSIRILFAGNHYFHVQPHPSVERSKPRNSEDRRGGILNAMVLRR